MARKHPLGRLLQHDPRSRSFGVTSPIVALSDIEHQRHVPIFDQGQTSSCTGNAAVGALGSGDLWDGTPYTEADAIRVYSEATHLDGLGRPYPTNDRGSSGLGVAKAAVKERKIVRYEHGFSLNDCLRALMAGPVIIGVPWYGGMDTPHGTGALLRIAGDVEGGHEVLLRKIVKKGSLVGGDNSWSEAWGDKGRFTMTFATLERLLGEQGDSTRFVRA